MRWVHPLVFILWVYYLPATRAFSSCSSNDKDLLIIGLGRCGLQVAKQALPHFRHVYGTIRTPIDSSDQDGVHRIPMEAVPSILPTCSHALLTLPPTSQHTVLWPLLSSLPWIGLISTTSVYGNHNGGWVTEGSPCHNRESPYLSWEQSWPQARIFRCAGIYSADRSALHTVWQQGLSIDNNDTTSPTSRIHVDDLARAIVASMMQSPSSPHRIYNLADDCPAPRSTVMQYAAELLQNQVGVSIPVAEKSSTPTTTRTRRRLTDRKQVDNTRMKQELLSVLWYPTYREGLQAIVQDRTNPWWSA